MQYWGLTDKGMVRSENQDTFFAGTVQSPSGEATLCVVCDGMGGARAGGLASSTACGAFVDTVKHGFAAGAGLEALTAEAARAANDAVLRKAGESPEYRGMGTTLVAAAVCGDEAVVANVGDSRCYIIENGGIRQITRDHSLVEDMVDKGELTREQAWKHPRKNLITRAVGTESSVDCDIFSTVLGEGSYMLLCSDGLSNIVNSQEMLFEVLYGGSIDTAAQRMMDIALGRNASDNVTVVLLAR